MKETRLYPNELNERKAEISEFVGHDEYHNKVIPKREKLAGIMKHCLLALSA